MPSQPEQHDDHHHVRRVTLPSGRAIEVVYFDAPEQDGADQAVVGTRDLTVCPHCGTGFVQPVEWREASATHWEVELRCPSCEHREVGEFDQHTVDRFDEALDDGTQLLVGDLKRLARANMEEEVDRFAAALHAGALLPEDF